MTSVLAAPQAYPPAMVPHGQDSYTSSHTDSQTTSTTSSSGVHRGPISATLNFYRSPSDNSDPFNYVEDPPTGQPKRNYGDADHSVNLLDARGLEDTIDIDKQAFALLKGYPHNSAIDWSNEDSIKQHYYPEVEALLLKELKGAQRVLLFDHTIRKAEPNAHRAPVTRVHIDQTPKSAAQRVKLHTSSAEADELLQGRYRIVNVWRPLNCAVESFPLAFADSATVPDADMVGVEHRYPDRAGETAGIRFNEEHRWWYWSGVGNDERILLQCFDSERIGNRVPHSAFVDPRQSEGSKPRESIEVRALVFG